MRLPRLMRLTGQARGTIWLIAASAMLTPVSETFSQDLKPSVLWANGSAGPWGTAGNWDVGVPGDGDVAAIANGGTAQVTAAVSDIDALSVRSGTVDVGQGGSLTVTGGSVTGGGGSISVAGNGALTTASLANGGNLSVSGKDAKLTVSGNFANVGSLTLNTSGSDPYSIINVGGNANLSGGSIDLATTPAGASFDFGNSWGFLKAGSLFGQPSEITVGGAAPSLSRGLALQVATGGDGTSAVTVGNVPIAVVNRASGNVTVVNPVGAALDIKGYTFTSESGLLSSDSWSSLADQGATGWTEANPDATHLSEVNLLGSSSLAVGASTDLGAAWTGTKTAPRDEDLTFSYALTDGRVLAGAVEYSGPANDLVLNINPTTGEGILQNMSTSVGDFDVVGYNILSPSGALNPASFAGLGEQGWSIANPTATGLAEISLEASKVFSNGTAVSLGNIFTPGGAQDVTLQFGTADFALHPGTVEYGTPPPPPMLMCDLDGDGSVGFSDFLVLSANFGQPGGLAQGDCGDMDGTIGFPDFLKLSSEFGQSAAASTAAVPEPASAMLALLGLLGLFKFRKRAAQVCAVLLVLVLVSTSQPTWATDFDTRFIRLHPQGPNAQIGDTAEARGIANGTVIDVILNEDLTGKLEIIDLAGGAGDYPVNDPYLNGVNDTSMIDFMQIVSGTLEIPEGEWTIGFASDDGGWLTMPAISFDTTYGENGARTDGDGEIIFNGTRGHAWTAGTFTVPSGGITTGFEAGFFERGGGDDFEVGILPGPLFTGSAAELGTDGFELSDGQDGWIVTGAPFDPGAPGDFNADGVVDNADFMILTGNFQTATSSGDMTGDGFVDLQDFSQFAAVFPAPGAAAVPEPASWSLILLAAGMLLHRFRQHPRR